MKKGFTIIEIVIVIAIIVVVSALIIDSFPRLNASQALSKDTAGLIAVLNQARTETLSSRNDSTYGVHISTNQLTLFMGSSYVVGDSNNVDIPFNSQVMVGSYSLQGGGSDIVFNRLTGETSQYGSITLRLVSDATQTKTVNISATGIINGTP